MGRILRVQMLQGKVMDSFRIRRGRVFSQFQDSEDYLLFLTNSNPDPNFFIIIPAPPCTGIAASPLPVRPPSRPRGGVVYSNSASNNRDPVDVVVVVVFIVIVVIPVPKIDTSIRLQKEEGYPHVDNQPGIPIIVGFSPHPPPHQK